MLFYFVDIFDLSQLSEKYLSKLTD